MTATTPTPRSKLKAFKGTALVSEQLLPGIASSVESFYIDENIPRVPVVAVSVGSSVLFYRNMKPYFKYTLPSLPIDPLEDEIWRKVSMIHIIYEWHKLNRFWDFVAAK